MKYLCTLFDYNYLPLGLSLYYSIEKNFENFHLWILALDNDCFRFLNSQALKNVTLISLKEIESEDVLVAKGNRTWQEYCWTLSPVLPSYVLKENSKIDHITYLDSDIFFYSDPKPIYDEIGEKSIMIIPHRFPDRLKHLEANGIYNVQMVYFKRDRIGESCLANWRAQCLEWCYSKLETNRFGDQKYLDNWPQSYENLCVLSNEQTGVALWNVEKYNVAEKDGRIYIDKFPLIFYHFHMFKFYSDGVYSSGSVNYNLNFSDLMPIYTIYVNQIVSLTAKFNLSLKKLSISEIFTMIERKNFHSVSITTQLFWQILLGVFVYLKKIGILGRNILKNLLKDANT
ncbi:glycosyl transferase [Leptospira sp. 201903070]|uniref:Glycosyl transferase n=1 Tax=Leptospira ainlahdjerensis TaxID=2810033 RepID=A0ABS2UBV0_9LEPT|nr:glycosyl transferase [Leptospira ainlahdjerensis]MBM9577279.1 glycosyl transferase [Leptospira ainlahdjerensis]